MATTLLDIKRAAISSARAGDMERAKKYKALYQSLSEEQTSAPRVAPKEESNILEDVFTGFGSGVVGLYESTALGAAAAAEEENELQYRKRIQDIAQSFRPEGGDPDSVTYKLSQGLGSIAALLPRS